MRVGIDFDGTICEHTYPQIGKSVPHAIRVIKRIQSSGHQIILWTVRGGKELQDAVDYCLSKDIKLWGINENPDQVAGEAAETDNGSGSNKWSCKAYMHILIDDVALGCPMKNGSVDWLRVEVYLEERGWFI